MEKTLLNAAMGMLTVFFILIIISIIISGFQFIAYFQNKKIAKMESITNHNDSNIYEPYNQLANINQMSEELVAVISAAISAQTGLSTQNFSVRSIKRR